MVATIDRGTPVLFLDTQKHFGETLRYRDLLVARLGLTDVRSLTPDPGEVARQDPDGMLWHRAPDACCALRKVVPLERALRPFAAWITGRKRYQGGSRAALPAIEAEGPRVKINPLASFGASDIEAEFAARGLPPHPLVADGFLSIGCMPCTSRPVRAADPRSGRWAETEKTECGIHQSLNSSCL
jgi:phosphoadenosine phosphosulfate reductase